MDKEYFLVVLGTILTALYSTTKLCQDNMKDAYLNTMPQMIEQSSKNIETTVSTGITVQEKLTENVAKLRPRTVTKTISKTVVKKAKATKKKR